jgi:hypothetical protein
MREPNLFARTVTQRSVHIDVSPDAYQLPLHGVLPVEGGADDHVQGDVPWQDSAHGIAVERHCPRGDTSRRSGEDNAGQQNRFRGTHSGVLPGRGALRPSQLFQPALVAAAMLAVNGNAR